MRNLMTKEDCVFLNLLIIIHRIFKKFHQGSVKVSTHTTVNATRVSAQAVLNAGEHHKDSIIQTLQGLLCEHAKSSPL